MLEHVAVAVLEVLGFGRRALTPWQQHPTPSQ